MAFESWEYEDPYLVHTRIESREHKAKVKAQRKSYRNHTGCKSCARFSGDLNICMEGRMPNIEKEKGVFWCKWWWDHRSGKPAPEIE